MRALLIGEGKHERSALPTIVRRVNTRIDDYDFKQIKDVRPIHGTGRGFYKKAVGAIIEADKHGYEAVVIVIDEDNQHNRREQMNLAQQNLSQSALPRACGIAIRTFDAWFLADQVALSEVTGRTVQRQPDPETITDPKRECVQLMRNTDLDGLSDLYSRLAERMDIEIVCHRCQMGFQPFSRRVERLSDSDNPDS